MTSIKIVQFLRPPTSLVHLRPKLFHLLDLGRPISNEPSPLSNDNQSIKRLYVINYVINYILSVPFFRLAFVSSINSLILPGFPLTSFHLAEASLSTFSWIILLCVQLSKNITKCILFIIIHIFSTYFAINLFYLHNLKTWTMEQQLHRAWERTKSKQKQNQVTSRSNWQRAMLFDLAHKQCNGIIKGRLHCLTSEWGRFLVNNILMFDSTWYRLVEIQFSLTKK